MIKYLKRIGSLSIALMMAFGMVILSACGGETSSSLTEKNSSSSEMINASSHECESECPDCEKCTNAECEENVCEEKCEGHEGTHRVTWDLQNVTVTLVNGGALPKRVEDGKELAFVVTEKKGYVNLAMSVNGQAIQSRNGVYKIVVGGDMTVNAYAEAKSGSFEYRLTDATVELREGKPCYVLKGDAFEYTVADLQSMYFDMQNYLNFNEEYGWTTTQVKYNLLLKENAFEIYTDLSNFPIDTCLIPHFNGKNSDGDVSVSVSDGTSILVNGVRYSIDMAATSWGLTCVTIVNEKGVVSAPSDTTAPTINEIKNYNYYDTIEIPRIDIATENAIAIDDESLIKGWKVPEAVYEYDYVNAEVSVSNCEGYEMENAEAEVKVRGNYTSTYPKKPIRIKFNQKQAMCGLNEDEKFKNWVLLAEYKDSSMLRNSVAFYLGNSIFESDGYYCTDCRYVEVYLNGVYNGLYLLVEQQEVKDERIQLPEAIDPEEEPDNPNVNSVKIGYSIEYDGYYYTEKAEETFTITYDRLRYENGNFITPRQNGFTIKSDIYFEGQRDFIQKCVQNIWDIVYDATHKDHSNLTKNPYYTLNADGEKVVDSTIKTPREAVERVIDVRSLVDAYILNELCQDPDLGWSSFYMSLDMSETGNRLLMFEAPWDFDSALGSAVDDNTKLYAQNKMHHNSDEVQSNPWLMVCSREAWFWTHVQAKWNALEAAGMFTGALSMIDYFAVNYADVYAKNFARWSECIGRKMENQQIDLIATFQTQAEAAAYLKSWLETRITNLNDLIDKKVKDLLV